MTQRCCICKTKVVSCWIPVDPKDKSLGSYPVCSSESCKFSAWNTPAPSTIQKKLKA